MIRRVLLLLLCIAILLTGCWDRRDIENRAYILGVAIDRYPPIPMGIEGDKKDVGTSPEEEKFIRMELHTEAPIYAMTVQVPIISKAHMLSLGQGAGAGGGEGSRTWEIMQIGNSFMEMSEELATRINYQPYYGHLQAIIISEDVARNGIAKVLDFFVTHQEMRRRTKVFISVGEAKRILDVTPRIEDYSAIYLSKLPMNTQMNSRTIYRTDIGEVLASYKRGEDFALPMIMATKDEIKDSGAAAFKNDKLVGWITEKELEYVKLIRGFYRGGVFTGNDPKHREGVVAFTVMRAKTKVTPEFTGGLPTFRIEINIKGNYIERANSDLSQDLDLEYVHACEKSFEDKIKSECEATIKRMQKEYGTDVFHFCDILKTREPGHWEGIKGQWREIFPNVKTVVDVKVILQSTGTSR